MAEIPEKTRLEEVSLPRILLQLYRNGFGGSVTLSRDKVGKRFLFQEGIPIFAESNLPSESLGVQLMDAGTLSRSDYSEVVTYVHRNSCKEGSALLALKFIDPKGLFLALKEQLRTRLIECFGWPHGEFIVDSRSAPSDDAQPFRSDLYRLVQQGIETHWSTDRILADLEPHMASYPAPSESFANLCGRLLADHAVETLYEALDGSLSLWRAVQLANTPRALAAAWVLDASGALLYTTAPRSEEPAQTALDQADAQIEIVFENQDVQGQQERKTARSVARPAPVDPTATVASEAMANEILARAERLGSDNLYECLGVEPDASPSEIKAVYLRAAKLFHPDTLTRSKIGEELRGTARRVFVEISKAYGVLSNAAKRADYDNSLHSPDATLDVEALTRAETLYRKGEILIQAGNFMGALEYLEPAIEIWPEEGVYQGALGWALYKKRPSEPERALEYLEHAVELDPGDGVLQFRLSVVLRALGMVDRATEILELARRLEAAPEGNRG